MKSYRPTVPNLMARLRLKAEASRLAILQSQPDTRDPMRKRQILEEGNRLDADFWMLQQVPINAGLYHEWVHLGEAADAVADACEALEMVTSAPVATREQRVEALTLMAESLCMFRIAHRAAQTKVFGRHRSGVIDPDQQLAFKHTAQLAIKWRVRLPFMTLDDYAKTDDAAELRQAIAEFIKDSVRKWGTYGSRAAASRRMDCISRLFSRGGSSCS